MSWTTGFPGMTLPGATNNADVFTGFDSIGEVADGLGGADYLIGNGGDDSLEGGAGFDVILGGQGNDSITDRADGAIVLGDAGNDTIAVTLDGAYVENAAGALAGDGYDLITVVGAGLTGGPGGTIGFAAYGEAGDDTLVTGVSNDGLFGGGGSDIIDAGSGNDLIYAEFEGETPGNDSITAGGGNDTVYSYDGVDTLDGGEGTDIAQIDRSGATAGLTFTAGQDATLTGDGTILRNFEQFAIVAGSGNDVLSGGAGNDSLIANAGIDNINGDGGNDTLDGGAGFDVILGGQGNDSITDHADGAIVYGEGGNDTIAVTLDGAYAGSVPGALGGTENDLITVGGAGLTGFFAPGETLGLLAAGEAGHDTLLGGAANDIFAGDSGDDSINGGQGNNRLSGGDGSDTITAGSGNDFIDTGGDNDLVIWRIGDGNDSIAMGTGNDTLDLEGWTGDDTDNWTFTTGSGGTTYTYNAGTGAVFTLTTSGVETVTCFAPGTRILTPRGEVPVETLRAGDLVVAPGRGAPLKPVRWVGHTRVDIARHRDKRKVAPVLIRAGALGAGVPARDLRVSPEHAFLLQGRLVPAHLLVNGTTIIQELWHRAMTYWHVELDEHGVLVAEGALAESYFDDGNRHLFDNGVIALHADFAAGRAGRRYATEAFARPVIDADDPALRRIRAALPRPASHEGIRSA